MDTHAVLCDTYMTQMMMLGNPYHNAELSKMAVNGVVCPRTFYMDLNSLRLLAIFGDEDSRGRTSVGTDPE